jgi:hypothetical protein
MSAIRPEITGRRAGATAAEDIGIGHNRVPPLPTLTALQLETHISVEEAAKIKGVSRDTFEREYPHLIKRVSARRLAVKIRDLVSDPQSSAA